MGGYSKNLNSGTQGMNIQRGPVHGELESAQGQNLQKKTDTLQQHDAKKPDALTSAYDSWRQSPGKRTMGNLITAADPIINNAMTSYSGGVPVRSTAKLLVSEAVKKYDPNKGTKLSTYLMTQLQPLQREARKRRDVIRMPERSQIDLEKLRATERLFKDEEGREPADSELADKLGMSIKRIRYLRERESGPIAEGSFEQETETSFQPGTVTPSAEDAWMSYVHHGLGPIDQKILEWRTGYLGKKILSNNEIAHRLKISPAAVSQRAAKIANQLEEGVGLII